MKKLFVLLLFPCLLFACTYSQQGDQRPELTAEQKSAFSAFTTLQLRTDEMNHLYSTFPDIEHPCYPPDTSFVITQSELLVVMTRFVEKHCTKLKVEERDQLAKNAVLAQTEYKVLHCLGSSPTSNYENGIPAEGTWILPDVLGRRDVVLEW